MKTFISTGILLLTAVAGAIADPSSCDAVAGNLAKNCGFEANLGAAPTDWTTDAGWAINAGTDNFVTNNPVFPHSGNNALQIGNLDNQGLAGIFQTITDVPGAHYSVSFFAFDKGAGGDAGSLFNAVLNGVTQVSESNNPASYTQFSYDFTGTGSDIIGFQAQTNPAEWYLDDVVVTGPAPGTAVPEPRTVGFLTLTAVMMAAAFQLLRRRAA